MRRIRRPLGAGQRSGVLAALLALIAGTIVAAAQLAGPRPPVTLPHMAGLDFVLIAMFAAAELALLHVEFQREAYSFSLSGVPVAVGALTVSPAILVVTRLAGALLAFAVQRPGKLKTAYNLSSYAFEAALVATMTGLLAGGEGPLDGRSALAMAGALIVVDVIMSTLLLKVISWHSGELDQRERTRVYVSGAIIAVLTTLLGLTFVILVDRGLLGISVLVGLLVVFAVVHRAYAVLHRRHASLELIHQFVSRDSKAQSVDELLSELLRSVCATLRASSVTLLLGGWEGQQQLLWVGEDGSVASEPASEELLEDWLFREVGTTGKPRIIPRGTSIAGLRSWLDARGMRDAIVVPVSDQEGVIGTLLVGDRQGDTATFDADDLPVAQTLAAHMAVALRNAALLQRLRHQANHDALTGIANRVLLHEALDSLHRDPAVRGSLAALLLLDLDRFKDVNDVLGHVAGDRLLCIVAERLKRLAPTGLVARLGGDEFAILLTGLASTQEAESLAHEAIAALKQPVMVNNIALNADASIGVAVYRPGGVSPGELLRQADLAMYAVKGTGRGVGLYTQDLERGHADRLALVADLRLALDRGELVMLYQPKLELLSGSIIGAEALVRWQHPKLGLLGPDAFIHLAESAGLIDQVTDTALSLALGQCRVWHDEGFDVSVAVNLSANNLHDEQLPERVRLRLAEAGLPPSALVLEITESSVVSEPERTIPILNELASLGCMLSLDDFGTGYSSLSYLQNLPVQEVKIDRSFVTNFVGDRRREALVAAIIGLGESLDLRVVAEGIEDAVTENQLRRMGCDAIQGYFIGPPASPERLARLFAARAARRPGWDAEGELSEAPVGIVIEPRTLAGQHRL